MKVVIFAAAVSETMPTSTVSSGFFRSLKVCPGDHFGRIDGGNRGGAGGAVTARCRGLAGCLGAGWFRRTVGLLGTPPERRHGQNGDDGNCPRHEVAGS